MAVFCRFYRVLCPTNLRANQFPVISREKQIMRLLDPWEIHIPEIFDGRRFCVYEHYCGELLFYVGSGQISRAFEFEPTRRCPTWQMFSEGKKIDVVITHRMRDRNEARRIEYKRIRSARPCGNDTLEEGQPFEWRPVVDGITPVATLVDRETVVRCEPLAIDFPSVAAASKCMGISRSAIYNSITGRHPDVKGYRFFRVEKRR